MDKEVVEEDGTSQAGLAWRLGWDVVR